MTTVQLEEKDQIASLTLNRPGVRNAFNAEMIAELTKCFQDLASKPELRVLVVRGAGESFCAGADLEWMKSMAQFSHQENVQDSQQLYEMFLALARIPFPVVALVHGHAMGGGLGLLAGVDIAVAVEGTQFCFSEVRLGLAPAVISSFVQKKVPRSSLQRYFLTAEVFDSLTAQQMGLVHEVVKRSEAEKTLQSVVRKLLQNGPQAVRASKKLLEDLSHTDDARNLTTNLIASLRVAPEGQEGLKAFLEKRKPNWTGV